MARLYDTLRGEAKNIFLTHKEIEGVNEPLCLKGLIIDEVYSDITIPSNFRKIVERRLRWK